MAGGYRRVVASGDGPTAVALDAGRFGSHLDLPESHGGPATAPDPITTLLGALAGCLVMSFRVVATKRRIELDDVRVEAWTDDPDYVGRIQIEVTLVADLDDAAGARLLAQAERACYVTRALSDDIEIATSVTVRPR